MSLSMLVIWPEYSNQDTGQPDTPLGLCPGPPGLVAWANLGHVRTKSGFVRQSENPDEFELPTPPSGGGNTTYTSPPFLLRSYPAAAKPKIARFTRSDTGSPPLFPPAARPVFPTIDNPPQSGGRAPCAQCHC